MTPRRFSHTDDLAQVNAWHVAHGQAENERSALPAIGHIVDGVACGFVYQTDSCVAFLDGFVTNPDADADDRGRALEAIWGALMADCQQRGVRLIVGQSSDYGFAKHAIDFFGFPFVSACIRFAKAV